MRVLVTGSCGLIGSEAVIFYSRLGHEVYGIDNNMRAEFFGPKGDTTWNLRRIFGEAPGYMHHGIDIRDKESIFRFFEEYRPEYVIHCAAQPSHDKAKEIPITDFEVNANGTLHLLDAARRFCPESVFIHLSTNKVYGDHPNNKPLKEAETRWDYADDSDYEGIDEHCSIDKCTHSMMGASKTAADIMAQEYGRYFGLKTGVFRGGCLTGPSHSGVQLHGFLNYLVKIAISGEPYTILGYKGKQVRDNIHSFDVISAFEAFRQNPRPGEVYNLGGGRGNSVSILEAIAKIEELSGRKIDYSYSDQNRIGDHICYISDLTKIKSHYPEWSVTRSLDGILKEMVETEVARSSRETAAR